MLPTIDRSGPTAEVRPPTQFGLGRCTEQRPYPSEEGVTLCNGDLHISRGKVVCQRCQHVFDNHPSLPPGAGRPEKPAPVAEIKLPAGDFVHTEPDRIRAVEQKLEQCLARIAELEKQLAAKPGR